MEMTWCKKCNEFMMYPERHQCPPTFEVCQPDCDPDYWETIMAKDAGLAAEKWAEADDCNSAEYLIIGGDDATVLVRKLGEQETQKFIVTAEAVPEYYAKEVAG
jgi:hypothetical protein